MPSDTLKFKGRLTEFFIFREGALKLKTTGFLQAEAFSSGEMKHGPIALINPDVEGSTKGKERYNHSLKKWKKICFL